MSTVVASASVARRQPWLGRGARASRAGVWVVLLSALALSVAPGIYTVSYTHLTLPTIYSV